MKRFICILLSVVMCLSLSMAAFAAEINESDAQVLRSYRQISDEEYYPDGYIGYDYPVRPGTAEWAALADHQEMVDACEIPADVLETMTTEELAQTILAYPLLADMFAYDDWNIGLSIVADHFNGLEEFSEKSDSASELVQLYIEQEPVVKADLDQKTIDAFETNDITNFMDADYTACNQIVRSMALTVLLTHDDYAGRINTADMETLVSAAEEKSELADAGTIYAPDSAYFISAKDNSAVSTRAVSLVEQTGYFHYTTGYATVKTPKNNSVTVDKKVCVETWLGSDGNEYLVTDAQYTDLPSSYKTSLNSTYYDIYGINPVSNPTVKYNCHSYAWYRQSTSNPYWMNNPSKYLTDGSYTEVGKIETEVGDRMVYYNSNDDTYDGISHSAVITDYTDYPKSKRTFVVKSKWGMLGLYEHSWSNCPYYYINKFPCDLKYYH